MKCARAVVIWVGVPSLQCKLPYNPGKKVGTVCQIWFKKSPPFPQCNVDPNQIARGRARSPNIDWWGWGWGVGKDMTNGELGGFFKTIHCPKFPYNREHWDNCNKVGLVSQLFFSRIVVILGIGDVYCYQGSDDCNYLAQKWVQIMF